jgi:hypothetical protein
LEQCHHAYETIGPDQLHHLLDGPSSELAGIGLGAIGDRLGVVPMLDYESVCDAEQIESGHVVSIDVDEAVRHDEVTLPDELEDVFVDHGLARALHELDEALDPVSHSGAVLCVAGSGVCLNGGADVSVPDPLEVEGGGIGEFLTQWVPFGAGPGLADQVSRCIRAAAVSVIVLLGVPRADLRELARYLGGVA